MPDIVEKILLGDLPSIFRSLFDVAELLDVSNDGIAPGVSNTGIIGGTSR